MPSDGRYRVVIEFDSLTAFEEFVFEHDARIGRSCSDVDGPYRVVEPTPEQFEAFTTPSKKGS